MPDSSFGPNEEKAGGTRYNSGKPGHFWCLPLGGLMEVARVGEYGATKYAPYDWAEGQSFSTLFDCAMRHLAKAAWKGLLSRDSESKKYHLAHAAWNLLCMLHFIHTGEDREFNDVDPTRGLTASTYRGHSMDTAWIADIMKEQEER